jgi:hypothetical protein
VYTSYKLETEKGRGKASRKRRGRKRQGKRKKKKKKKGRNLFKSRENQSREEHIHPFLSRPARREGRLCDFAT